jgi:hypothetical protein
MSSIQDCTPTIARGTDYATALVGRTISWSEVEDDGSCMDVYVPGFQPCLREYESPLLMSNCRRIITFEVRSVLLVFLVGIYALL